MRISDLHHKYFLGPTNPKACKKEIMAIAKLSDFCINCGEKTVPYTNAIPFEKTFIKIPGKCCMHCGQFYATKCNELFTAVRNNKYANDFQVILSDVIPEGQKKAIRTFYTNDNAIVLLKLKNIKTDEIIFITITREPVTTYETVYSYKETVARKILAILSEKTEHETIMLGDNEYEIINTFPRNHKECIRKLLIDKIYIRKNGGLYNPDNKDILVDLLIFSPVTKNYEFIRASYDAEEEIYYIEPATYKRFTMKYGRPDIQFEVQRNNQNDYLPFNDESILTVFGYNVNAKDALSSGQRHAILVDIMESKIATASEIIRILRNNISLRPQAKFSAAIDKWEEDIKFVQEYKSTPSDVLISKQEI